LVEQTPLQRMGHAEDVAAAVAFVLADRAGCLTASTRSSHLIPARDGASIVITGSTGH
jgi:NAD(P)-dependent dehydrogenase (short-subunit alcohol dehydrogenase family)